MFTNLLESDRTDRYEFEVFIGQVNFTGYEFQALETDAKRNEIGKSRLKTHPFFTDVKDSNSIPKYTIKIVLDEVLKSEISSYDKTDRERKNNQCVNDYDDSKPSDSFTNIVKQIAERYEVDEIPVCNAQSLCYKFKDDSDPVLKKPTLNKGVVCIFNCLPRTLITIFQKNPLELTIFEDLTNDQIKFGTLSIFLSGPTGFTDAVGHHFHERGYDPYTHTAESVHKMLQHGAHGFQLVIGEISVRVKLTCHGPLPMQQQQQADRIVLRSDRPSLQPIHVDVNEFDFPLDKLIVQPHPKMMYYDTVDERENKISVLNPEIREMLRCWSVQESLAKEWSDASDRKSCSCPAGELMANNVVEMLSDEAAFRSAGQETSSSSSDASAAADFAGV